MKHLFLLLVLAGCGAPKSAAQPVSNPPPSSENTNGNDNYEILPSDVERIKSINGNSDLYHSQDRDSIEEAFQNAVKSGDYHAITNILIETGDPMFFDRVDHFHHTMTLSEAAFYNQKKLIDFFLALGYNPAVRSGDDIDYGDAFQSQPWTVTEAAAAGGNSELLHYLINKKLPEPREKKSEPLFWAAFENQAATIEYIIKNKLISPRGPEAQRALRAAMGLEEAAWFIPAARQPEAAQKLIDLGVVPSPQTIRAAFANHDAPSLKMLESRYPKLIDNSFSVMEIKPSSDSAGLKEMLSYLKDKGLDISKQDSQGRNIFFILAQRADPEKPSERLELVRWLMGQGISIYTSAPGPLTKQPLSALDMFITRFSTKEEMKFYLSLKDNHRWTPQLSELLISNYIEDAANGFLPYGSGNDFKTLFDYFEKLGVVLSPNAEFSKNFNPIASIKGYNTDPIYAYETGFSSDLSEEMISYFEAKGWPHPSD